MKNINKIIFGLVILATLSQSCKKTLVDTNTNPYLVSNAGPEFLFAGATQDFNLTSRDQTSKKYGTTMTWMQYVVPDGADAAALAGKYWDISKISGPNPGFPYYNDYYNGDGRDMHRIIALIDAMPDAQKETYQGVKAMCSIIETYQAWKVADIYGAMPYKEAFQPEKYPLPMYDLDYDLYKVFDQQLKDAATLLKINTSKQIDVSAQDLFYGGDYSKWLAFANTLRIKIAQRYEKRDAANLTSVLNDIATNFNNNVISTVDGSFGYNQTQGWNNNLDDINVLLFSYDAAFPFVEFLKSTTDPRIRFMVRQNDFGTNFKGYVNVKDNGDAAAKAALLLPKNQVRYWGKHPSPASADDPSYGFTGNDRFEAFNLTTTINPQNLGILSAIQTRLFLKNGGFGGSDSRADPAIYGHNDETIVDGKTIKMRTPYLTYAETCFMMAEIAQKGGNGLGKSASDWFYAGVQASFDQYKALAIATNVPKADTVTIGNFATTLPYLGLPSIYSQAWVNFLLEPDESWAMWKRTGYPHFTDVRAGDNGKIGDGSTIAYLENLWTGSKNLVIARRDALSLSSGSQPNNDNYQKALQAMIAKDPNYGNKTSDTFGRIWWDMK
ncbi:MAG: SusD/RagB family nutrient-binding outer membrane lipoprotein [Ginsengibacter sp.]